MTAEIVVIDGQSLRIEQVEQVARQGARVTLGDDARERMTRSRALVERLAHGTKPVYGLNTGFGALAEIRIDEKDLERLQRNLILSHAVGVGEPLPFDAARASMVLRANVLATGCAGVRVEVVETLIDLLNADVAPRIPSRGSVGASGDLAPLAHIALLLMGDGEAMLRGLRVSAAEALAAAGRGPLVLQAKEGLALVNGTQVMAGLGCLVLLDSERLASLADVAGACTVEGYMGTSRAFDPRIQAVRPHPGQATVARNLRDLLADSQIYESHRFCGKVQDPYSMRCMPQVHGATRDALAYVRRVLEVEINSATDNPLVFADDDEMISGGNFHGQPLALAMDFLGIAMAELASISERRTEHLVNPTLSGLPAFLVEDSGLNSGLMITQVTAAALISENKVLAHPASVDSIPSSANREDHVSMGMTAALKARQIVDNVCWVLSIEILAACQALEFRLPLRPGVGPGAVYDQVRTRVPPLHGDRRLELDMHAVHELMTSGRLLDAVRQCVPGLS
ncbi:MAG: histidine ammonia-lyase [Pseudomonadota bacterium]